MTKSQPETKITRQLKIIFDGVIMVGPTPPESGTRMGPFFGVMAHATRRLSDRARRRKRERLRYTTTHVPTIFTRAKPTRTSRPPDRVFQLSPCHPHWYMWHPFRERLEFILDGDVTPGELTYPRDADLHSNYHSSALTEALTFYDIRNAADMRHIWPNRSVLLDGLLSADPGISGKVVAQVLVPRGIVTGASALKRGPYEVAFDPHRGGANHPSLVPNAAVGVMANKVKIATYSLDSGEALDPIEFKLTENMEIWVSNGDPTDIEIDMHKQSIIIAKCMAERNQKVNPHEDEYVKRLAADSGLFGGSAMTKAQYVKLHGGGSEIIIGDLKREDRRAGNADLDFEIFYTLLKNDHLAGDGKGLPVPKRIKAYQKFDGPDCYISVGDTNDQLQFKSKSKASR